MSALGLSCLGGGGGGRKTLFPPHLLPPPPPPPGRGGRPKRRASLGLFWGGGGGGEPKSHFPAQVLPKSPFPVHFLPHSHSQCHKSQYILKVIKMTTTNQISSFCSNAMQVFYLQQLHLLDCRNSERLSLCNQIADSSKCSLKSTLK